MSENLWIAFACVAVLEFFLIAELLAGSRNQEIEYSHRELRAAVKIAQLRQQLSSKPTYTSTYYPPYGKQGDLRAMVDVGIITEKQANSALHNTDKEK